MAHLHPPLYLEARGSIWSSTSTSTCYVLHCDSGSSTPWSCDKMPAFRPPWGHGGHQGSSCSRGFLAGRRALVLCLHVLLCQSHSRPMELGEVDLTGLLFTWPFPDPLVCPVLIVSVPCGFQEGWVVDLPLMNTALLISTCLPAWVSTMHVHWAVSGGLAFYEVHGTFPSLCSAAVV